MTDKEAMQQALDALEFIRRIEQLGMVTDGTAKKAITTLRERLAQPAQQPEQEPLTDRELFKQALEALESHATQRTFAGGVYIANAAIALRERLAQPEQEHIIDCPRCGHCCPQQPEQEPVAWTTMPDAYDWTFISGSSDPNGKLDGKWHPLYTTPQPAQQQGGGNLPPPLEQQPVAWEDVLGAIARGWTHDDNKHKTMDVALAVAIAKEVQDMVTSPPASKPWVGLTDEKLKRMWVEYRAAIPRYLCFARAIEAKLREKNQKENPGVL